jgi:hypothetical protein
MYASCYQEETTQYMVIIKLYLLHWRCANRQQQPKLRRSKAGRGGYDYGNAASIWYQSWWSNRSTFWKELLQLHWSRASNGVVMITTKKVKRNWNYNQFKLNAELQTKNFTKIPKNKYGQDMVHITSRWWLLNWLILMEMVLMI